MWKKCFFIKRATERFICDLCTLKRRLETQFGLNISFDVKQFTMVYASNTKPCDYAVAALHGCGLSDDDFVRAFGRMIRRKVKFRKEREEKWPMTPEELLASFDEGPLPELYNAIYYTTNDSGIINDHGYAVASSAKATKLWSIASDWEYLITKKKNPKQAILGLVIHRNTGSKEAISFLHKSCHTVSYKEIQLQNSAWAKTVRSQRAQFTTFRKGVVTHSTIDNNDGRQDTHTGSGTTHDTNKTIFQVPTKFHTCDRKCRNGTRYYRRYK